MSSYILYSYNFPHAVQEPRDLKWSGHNRPLVVLLEYCADCSIRVSRSFYTGGPAPALECYVQISLEQGIFHDVSPSYVIGASKNNLSSNF